MSKEYFNNQVWEEKQIINTHVTNIMSLPVIQGTNPDKIDETPLLNLQALETMGKISEVNGYLRMMLDKLEGIQGDLV